MNLYEVIFWGADGSNSDEDTIYLVRAADWSAAVKHVQINASPSLHKIHHTTLAHRVHEIGIDASPSGEAQEKILRGPYFQCAYNHGWRSWEREIAEVGDSDDWKERPPLL